MQQLLLKQIPTCFELKFRAHSLLSQCYQLVGTIASVKQSLKKGLELTVSAGTGCVNQPFGLCKLTFGDYSVIFQLLVCCSHVDELCHIRGCPLWSLSFKCTSFIMSFVVANVFQNFTQKLVFLDSMCSGGVCVLHF